MGKSFILFTLLLLLISCGGKKGTTESDFSIKFGAAVSGASGGLMLFGSTVDGSNYSFARNITDTITLNLDNGTWNFYAIAWTGAGEMEGTPKCALLKNKDLSGESVTISMDLTTADCAEADFGFPTNKNLSLGFCRQGATPVTYSGAACDGLENKGYFSSARIVLPEYNKGSVNNFTNPGNGLISECKTHPGTTSSTTTNLTAKIPAGFNGQSPFFTIVEGFYGSTDCDNTIPARAIQPIPFPSGYHQGVVFNNAGDDRLFVTTSDNDACSFGGTSATGPIPFAGGNGDFRPYLICSKAQLEAIGGSSNWGSKVESADPFLYAANYRLLANINYAKTPLTPLGEDISGSNSNAFTGTFDGNNKVIGDFQIFGSSQNDVGFIRHLFDTATVKNLNLAGLLSCSGCNGVGLLAGKADGGSGSGALIENIKVSGHVDGDQEIGGVVGLTNSGAVKATLRNVHAIISVDSKGATFSNAGGLVGLLQGGAIEDSSVYVDLHAGKPQAGGIVGNATTSSTIQRVSSRGFIRGNYDTGGIAGALTSASWINNSYTLTSITGNCQSCSYLYNVGGAVGRLEAGTSVLNTFATEGMIHFDDTFNGNDDLAYTGGLVGNNSGGGDCSGSFFTGPDNLAGNGPDGGLYGGRTGVGCGTRVSADASGIYDYTSTYAGWDKNNSNTTGNTWTMADDGYDYLKLSWELGRESEIPYLYRPCSGNFASLPGDDTDPNNPKWICSVADTAFINSNKYYVLKRDLDFTSQTAYTNFMKAVGYYHLDGNGHKWNNMRITFNGEPTSQQHTNGIFGHMYAGSYVRDLIIQNLKMERDAYTISVGNAHAGVVAGYNSGEISGVEVVASSIILKDITGNAGSSSLNVGGIAGTNATGAEIKKSETDAKIIFEDPWFSNSTEKLTVGLIAGSNFGTMDNVITRGSIKHNSTNGTRDPTNANYFYGGAVYLNTGTISKVAAQGRLEIGNSTTGAGGSFAGFAYQNTGSIADSYAATTFNIYNGNNSTADVAGFVYNNSGTINRAYLAESQYDNNNWGGTPPTVNSIYSTDTGTITDTHCFATDSIADGGFTGCTDFLNNASPDINFTIDSATGRLQWDYTNSVPTAITSYSIVDWNLTDNLFSTTATWILEDNPGSSSPPELVGHDGPSEDMKYEFPVFSGF